MQSSRVGQCSASDAKRVEVVDALCKGTWPRWLEMGREGALW